MLYAVIGLILGGALTAVVMSSHGNYRGGGMMMGGSENAPMSNTGDGKQTIMGMGNIDGNFIEQMIPHHEDAITMAGVALKKAQHAEIKSLANDITRSQSAEIKQMEEWYKAWYGKDVPQDNGTTGMNGMGSGGMHMGMMGDDTDMSRLESAENFDQAFIEEMIPHHQMAVMMANMLLSATDRPEMKKLAEDIITAQKKEIEDMRTWAKAWGYTLGGSPMMNRER